MNRRSPTNIAVGFVLCGGVLALIEFARLGMGDCLRTARMCFYIAAMTIGPYVLLSLFLPLAWKSSIGRAVFYVAAGVLLILGVVLSVSPPASGIGGLIYLAIPTWQYMGCAVAITIIIAGWLFSNGQSSEACVAEFPEDNQVSSFDLALVAQMERAMSSKETHELQSIIFQAESNPDQYAKELVEAVRRLLESRKETP